MNLLDFYPQPQDLIANELKTVRFLSTNPHIGKKHQSFKSAANLSYNQFKAGFSGFRFGSSLELFHREMPRAKKVFRKKGVVQYNSNTRLIISGLIHQKPDRSYDYVSYAFAVCRLRSNHSSILRKFHFDVTTESKRRQPQPISHLQYGGEMIDVMDDLKYKDAQLSALHPYLSEPRIFFWPMSLALLIDMALREFPNEEFDRFRILPEWRNLIKSNEHFILKPFFEQCIQIVGKKPLSDEFYLN